MYELRYFFIFSSFFPWLSKVLTHKHKDTLTHLAQGCIFHCDLTQEKVDVVTIVNGVQEVRLCREKGITIIKFLKFRGKTLFFPSNFFTFGVCFSEHSCSYQQRNFLHDLTFLLLKFCFSLNCFLKPREGKFQNKAELKKGCFRHYLKPQSWLMVMWLRESSLSTNMLQRGHHTFRQTDYSVHVSALHPGTFHSLTIFICQEESQ